MNITLYELLGLNVVATPDDVEQAFAELLLDRPADVAGERGRLIRAAYGLLSRPDDRLFYDQLLAGKRQDFQFPRIPGQGIAPGRCSA